MLWLGGYAILERPNVGFVTTIDQHVHVVGRRNQGNTVLISAPQLATDIVRGTVDTQTGKITLDGAPKELNLLRTAAELSLMHALSIGFPVGGFDIATLNDPAFAYRKVGADGKKLSKSGMGSSAAVTVATVGAVMELFEEGAFTTDVHKISQMAHAHATKKVGSGFDIAAANYGSITYTRFSEQFVRRLPDEGYTKDDVEKLVNEDWDYRVTPLTLPSFLHPVVANFVGESANTASLVGVVNRFKGEEPNDYGKLIVDLNAESQKAIDALKRMRGSEDLDALQTFQEAFDAGRALSKQLWLRSKVHIKDDDPPEVKLGHIEPDDVTELIERSRKAGAFVAKSPGAGGKDSLAALCRTEEDATRLREMWRGERGLEVLNVTPQRRGLSVSRST